MSKNDNEQIIPPNWLKALGAFAVLLAIVGLVLPDRYNAVELVVSLIITWTVCLVPPLLMRLANKEAFSVWWAVGLCVVLWFAYHIIFVYLGSDGKVGSAVLGILAAYYILRKGSETKTSDIAATNATVEPKPDEGGSQRGWGK